MESRAVGPLEGVVTFHVPGGGLQDAETLVLMGTTGSEERLLPHDALTVDFGVLSRRIVNPPMAKEKLRLLISLVLQLDMVGEDKAPLFRGGIDQGKVGPYPDKNA
jgi:hypothetical protein